MSTVLEIESAIETFPPSDYAELLAWLDERRAAEVDAKFEQAILAGKFDAMADRALRDAEASKGTPLDELIRSRPRSAHPSGGASRRLSRC